MRINVYAEEMPDQPRVEMVEKHIHGRNYTGIRLYLELPVTVGNNQVKGPFIHHHEDDDSAAITFWGKRQLIPTLEKMLKVLKEHYALVIFDQRGDNDDILEVSE